MKTLIEKYKSEIKKYDTDINAITLTIRAMRKGAPVEMYFEGINEAITERKKIQALRDQLFEVTKDLTGPETKIDHGKIRRVSKYEHELEQKNKELVNALLSVKDWWTEPDKNNFDFPIKKVDEGLNESLKDHISDFLNAAVIESKIGETPISLKISKYQNCIPVNISVKQANNLVEFKILCKKSNPKDEKSNN